MKILPEILFALCILVGYTVVSAAPLKSGWPDFETLEKELKAEGFTPLTPQQWQPYDYFWDAWKKSKDSGMGLLYHRAGEKGLWGKIYPQMAKNLDGTAEGIARYISTIYCISGLSPTEDLSEGSMQYLWMEQSKLAGWITMQEFKYNQDVPSDIIKKQSAARMRLVARLLKRLTTGYDPTKPDWYSGSLPNPDELTIGYGFRSGGGNAETRSRERPAKLDGSLELTEKYYREGKATEEMLSPAQIEWEKKRIAKAKEDYKKWLLREQGVAVRNAEDNFLRGLQRLTGQTDEIKEALILAGFDTPSKQKAFFERHRTSGAWNETVMPKLMKDVFQQ